MNKSTTIRFAPFLLIVSLSAWPLISFAEEIFTWTDENGTVSFSDSLHRVPERYRDQVKSKKFNEARPQETISNVGASDLQDRAGADSKEAPKRNRYEVPFAAYEGSARRIIIQVTFNGAVTAPMALDTGAPGMMISPGLAERLGLFGKDEERLLVMAGGVGGSVPAVRAVIDRVQVGGAEDRFIPTTVAPSISSSFEGLIGMDFAAHYSVKIDSVKSVVIFEEVPQNHSLPDGRDELWWRSLYREFASHRAQWKEFGERLDLQIRDSLVTVGPEMEEIKKLRAFSSAQYRGADTLLSKLDHYANEHAVPRPWRRY